MILQRWFVREQDLLASVLRIQTTRKRFGRRMKFCSITLREAIFIGTRPMIGIATPIIRATTMIQTARGHNHLDRGRTCSEGQRKSMPECRECCGPGWHRCLWLEMDLASC